MNMREAIEWTKNLVRQGVTKSALMDAATELGLNWRAVDRRYQYAGEDDLSSEQGVYFILTGEKYPRGGYTWASQRKIAMKMWDNRFADKYEADLMGSRYKGIHYVPFHELSSRDQQRARSSYPYKNVGAKYNFIDEHYYYPVEADGSLTHRRAQRVLAIPYKLIMDDAYMASLGYEISPKWQAASELVKIAKSLVAGRPEEAYVFATKMADVAGVDSAVVNDFVVVSHNPTIFEVDIHVYVNPEIGGVMTNRLRARGDGIARAMGIRMVAFFSPRADKRIDEVGMAALQKFYTENPYKVTVACRGDE